MSGTFHGCESENAGSYSKEDHAVKRSYVLLLVWLASACPVAIAPTSSPEAGTAEARPSAASTETVAPPSATAAARAATSTPLPLPPAATAPPPTANPAVISPRNASAPLELGRIAGAPNRYNTLSPDWRYIARVHAGSRPGTVPVSSQWGPSGRWWSRTSQSGEKALGRSCSYQTRARLRCSPSARAVPKR
jgi:hypothetical protein